jgi:hypothetical protein
MKWKWIKKITFSNAVDRKKFYFSFNYDDNLKILENMALIWSILIFCASQPSNLEKP